MKKFMLLATAVGMTLTSCVNEVETPMESGRQVIAFDAPAMKSTRVNWKGEISGSGKVYPTAENFKVFCRYYKDSYKGWTTSTDIQDYFTATGDEAKHDGSYWATTKVYYWPDAGYSLAFAAISPSEFGPEASGATVTRTEKGIQIEGFKTEAASDEHYDLMYTHTNFDRTKANNSGNAVSLAFEHALTSIVFSSQKADASIDYQITDIQVTGNFYVQGNFNQGITGKVEGGVYTESETPTWDVKSFSPVAVDYAPSFTAVNVPLSAPEIFTSGTSAILPIPQKVPADAVVKVTYTKTSLSTTTTHTASIKMSDFRKTDNSQITEWERGKRYVYRISFGKNERIYFEPTLTDWVTEPTLIYTIQ